MQENSSALDYKPLLKNLQAYNVVQQFLAARFRGLITEVQRCNMREEKLDFIERMAEVEFISKTLEREKIKVDSGKK